MRTNNSGLMLALLVAAATAWPGCKDDVAAASDGEGCVTAVSGPLLNELSTGAGQRVEILNFSGTPRTLAGWTLSAGGGGIEQRYSLALYDSANQGLTPVPAFGFRVFDQALHRMQIANAGELRLLDESGRAVDCVRWPLLDVWHSYCRPSDGGPLWVGGCTETFGKPNAWAPQRAAPDASAWPGTDTAPTTVPDQGKRPWEDAPGVGFTLPPEGAALVINEVDSSADRVELYYAAPDGAEPLNVNGWILRGATYATETVLWTESIPPGGFLDLMEWETDLDISGEDTLRLLDPYFTVRDEITWCHHQAQASLCRFPDGGAFTTCSTATFGSANEAPDPQKLVLVPAWATAGEKGKGQAQFSENDERMRVAIASDGHVWASDPGNARVQRFDGQSGAFLDIPVTGKTVLAMAASPDGPVALVTGKSSVQLRGLDGALLEELAVAGATDLAGLGWSDGGVLYASCRGTGDVYRAYPLASAGPLPSGYALPDLGQLAVDDAAGVLFVASVGNGRVYVYDLAGGTGYQHGKHVGGWQDGSEPQPGLFGKHVGGVAAVEAESLLLLVDTDNSRVMLHALDHTKLYEPAADYGFLAAFGRPGEGCVELDAPSDVAASAALDLVVVADPWNERVVAYRLGAVLALVAAAVGE